MSRHWTRPWGFPGKAIEAIPTCKDAGGRDHGEINTENKYEELNVTKETKEIHRDWSSELLGRDIDIDVTQPRRCKWNWHALGDDEPDGKGRGENILCERTACAEKSCWHVWTPEERLAWPGQAEVNQDQLMPYLPPQPAVLWPSVCLCRSMKTFQASPRDERESASRFSHLLFPKIDATEIASVFCQFSFPSFAIIALFPFREGKHTCQEAWIIPWCSAPGHKSIQCFWGGSLESKVRKTKCGFASFYPLKQS